MKEEKKSSILYSDKWSPAIIFALRIFVGGLFIFSGFVKAIDPWGSLYKFQDYVLALGLPGLEPFLLFSAFAVAALEFMFGVFILIGAYRRGAPIVLLLMMAVMTPLTLWLAITNAVPDCGCFGDAIVISNWATFIKNLFLTLGILYLVFFNKRVKNIYGVNVQWIVGLFSFVFILWVASLGYFYQPLIDFRPYKVGNTIVSKPSEDTDGSNFVFTYEKNGVQKEFTIDRLPDETWNFVERHEVKKTMPKVDGQNLLILSSPDGSDLPDDAIKKDGGQLLLIFSDMKDIDVSYSYLMNELYDFAQSHGVDMIGLTPGDEQDIAEWNDLSMASYKIYNADDSDLKMIARGNPALVYLKDGKIMWKRTLQSVSAERLEADQGDFASVSSDFSDSRKLSLLVTSYLFVMVVLLILNRSYNVFNFSRHRIKKNQNKDVPLQSEKEE